jgi:hypothetical protein
LSKREDITSDQPQRKTSHAFFQRRALILAFLLLPLSLFCSLCGAQEPAALSRTTVAPVVHCFHNRNIDLMVLGTIGAAHARNPHFTWAHLDSLLQRIAPELLLVQIRPDHCDKQEFFDGAPDMAYLAYLARKMKIECRGIDWWLDMQIVNWDKINPEERIRHINENIRTVLGSTRAQMILIAVDLSFVDSLRSCLLLDSLREWTCPQTRFALAKIADLPPETVDFFRDGMVYLAYLPYASAARVQQKINDLRDIVRSKGYLFER